MIKLQPLIRPLYARAKAFHSDPAWNEARIRARLDRTQTPAERALVELMEAAKAGYVDQLSAVVPLMKQQDDDSFWARSSLLLSYAAPSAVLRQLVQSFAPEMLEQKDYVVQCFIAETILNSGLLWSAPVALKIMKAQVERDKMFSIPWRLSMLLESAPGDIMSGPDRIPEPGDWPEWFEPDFTYDDESYEKLALALFETRLAENNDAEEAMLFQGKLVDIKRLAYDLLINLGRVEDGEIVCRIRMILEAQTGIDLSAFFREDLVLDRMGAMQALEYAFDHVDFDAFDQGGRYFFGRRLS